MTMRALGHIVLFVVAWLTVELILVRSLGVAFVPLFAGGFAVWWFTTRRTPVDPNTIIVPYLLTVIAFIVHVCEEYRAYLLGYPDILKGAPVTLTLEGLLTFAATLGPIAWLIGAVMLLKRSPVGYFVASTFLFGMMFIEPTHFIAPFFPDGVHYVGGMWTAPLPIALGWYTFSVIRRETHAARNASV
jgi:hypothetical protein